MSMYTELILEGIARRDPERADVDTANVVEGVMRVGRTALDWISRTEFLHEVADIVTVLDAETVRTICTNLGDPIPAWALA